jgi:predicted NACHT family NTPase
LIWQAENGRLPSYLGGSRDVTSLSRDVLVRPGVRGSKPGQDPESRGHQPYALAADRDRRAAAKPELWLEAAANHDRLIVLADPGLGKSWLIRSETRRLARAALSDLADSGRAVIVPVPLRCDQLAAGEGPDLPSRAAAFLTAQGLLPDRSRDLLAAKIAAGEAVLLLDALDELTTSQTGSVRAVVAAWADQPNAPARCVITSRIAGYTGPPLSGAVEVELQPFTQDDVREFIRAWRLPMAGENQLTGRIREAPAVAAMARIPLLLAMLCSLVSQPGTRTLPATRTGLYALGCVGS